MSSLKSLVGGGGGWITHTYGADEVIPLHPNGPNTSTAPANKDSLVPFMLMQDLTVDLLCVPISATGGGSLVAGIYDKDLSLITDAAMVTVPTSTGIQELSTTEVTLLRGALYYFAVNSANAIIDCVNNYAVSSDGDPSYKYLPHHPDAIVGTYPGLIPNYEKSRSVAALPSSFTKSDFSTPASYRCPCLFAGKSS